MKVEIYKMIYKKGNNTNNFMILGKDFVENNKNKGKLIINNKKLSLRNIIPTNFIISEKIYLILCKNVYNKSCMFKNCESLQSLSLLSMDNYIEDSIEENYNEKACNKLIIGEYEKNSIYSMEDGTSSLDSEITINTEVISEISKMKEKNTEKTFIFYSNNNILEKLKDNYSILKEMFSHCKSLQHLPDISNWNTSNVCDMSDMFSHCKSLQYLPDISN